jgi:hypothetical protein
MICRVRGVQSCCMLVDTPDEPRSRISYPWQRQRRNTVEYLDNITTRLLSFRTYYYDYIDRFIIANLVHQCVKDAVRATAYEASTQGR